MNPRSTSIDAAAFGRLRALLASRFGLTPNMLNQSVGSNAAGRTRAQVAADLAAWLRDRPRRDA